MWPLSAWVPARQQVVGSPALRDYLVLFLYFLFYWSGVVVLKAGIRFLMVMLSFLRLLHLRWVICHIVALACLLVNLFGIGPHRLKDSFSCLVNHCFTSHYSSSWDVQIDRILHTLIKFCRNGQFPKYSNKHVNKNSAFVFCWVCVISTVAFAHTIWYQWIKWILFVYVG